MGDRPRRIAGVGLALLLLFAAAGCAGGGDSGAGAPPADDGVPQPSVVEPMSGELTTAAAAERRLVAGEPLTFRLELSPDLADFVRGYRPGSGRSLRLQVEGIEAPGVGAEVRVFVNRPEAGPETSLDDPGYAGEAGFFPLGDDRPPDHTFLFDAGGVLTRLADDERLIDGRFLDVTVVLMPPAAAPEGAEPMSLALDGVRLEVVGAKIEASDDSRDDSTDPSD